jgi:hypothetical protein
MARSSSTSILKRYRLLAVGAYALLAWVLLANQSLPFPLGDSDQAKVTNLLREDSQPRHDSWVARGIDPLAVMLAQEAAYSWLVRARTLAAVVALVGMVVWTDRTWGGWPVLWVAILGLVFPPLRWTLGTLESTPFFLALFVWGGLLALARPWSKTGTAEQIGAGLLWGSSLFAAPGAFWFGMAIVVHAVLSPIFRRRLETSFWGAFALAAALATLGAVLQDQLGRGLFEIGFFGSPASELAHIGELLRGQLGLLFTLLLILGCLSRWRTGLRMEEPPVAVFLWPVLALLLVGMATPPRLAMALPGFLFLAVSGLGLLGRVFVAKSEQRALATLLAFGLGYHLFFNFLPEIRLRQAYSREVEALARLIEAEVPTAELVGLFRLNPLVGYLNALHPESPWEIARPDQVLGWLQADPPTRPAAVWLDLQRALEPESGLEPTQIEPLLASRSTEMRLGERGVRLLRVDLGSPAEEAR